MVKDAQTRPEFADIHRQLAVDGNFTKEKVENFVRDIQKVVIILDDPI